MIALAHLVWAPLGPEPLRHFLRSYAAHPAGAEHELVVILNGSGAPGAHARERLLAELDGTPHTLIELARPVQDLTAYGEAAARLDHELICLLNSYAEVLADAWLAHLAAALAREDVGLAGATGNWESQAEFPRGGIEQWPQQLIGLRRARRDYPRFPNPHVRTSSFMIARERLVAMRLEAVRDKRDAYIVESGFHSITRQVAETGQRTVVVDRDGRLYDPPDWPRSRTFRSGSQERLLVADNQTRAYEGCSPRVRHALARSSWGSQAGEP